MNKLSFYAAAAFFTLLFLAGGQVALGQDLVRGKLGVFVKTKEKEYRARKKNIIPPETSLRIFIFPEKNTFIYAFHSDGKDVEPLHPNEKIVSRDSLILPAADTFYEIGAADKTAMFTLIVSLEAIPELNSISKGLSLKKWKKIEKNLIQKSRILDNSDQKLPFSLAGNVRGDADSTNADFLEALPVSSGKNLIIRTYDFQIKK